jgi:hypothetical protein
MSMKSITFRCTAAQYEQLNNTQPGVASNRTELITTALDAFLTYAKQPHVRQQDLFHLVKELDNASHGPRFAELA